MAEKSDLTTRIKDSSVYSIEALKDSWLMSFKSFFPLLGAWALSLGGPVLLLMIGAVVGGIFDKMAGFKHGGPATLVGLLIPGALISCFWVGWIKATLNVARGLPVRFGDLIRPFNQIVSGTVVLVISSILIGIGYTIFFIPGFLLTLKWQLAPYYVVDHNYGPIQAMKQSWNETNRIFIPLCILDAIFTGIASVSTPTFVGPVLCHIALGVASALVYAKWVMDDHMNLDEIETDA